MGKNIYVVPSASEVRTRLRASILVGSTLVTDGTPVETDRDVTTTIVIPKPKPSGVRRYNSLD